MSMGATAAKRQKREAQSSGVFARIERDNREDRDTMPPGEADADCAAFEARIQQVGEFTARLDNIGAQMGVRIK